MQDIKCVWTGMLGKGVVQSKPLKLLHLVTPNKLPMPLSYLKKPRGFN